MLRRLFLLFPVLLLLSACADSNEGDLPVLEGPPEFEQEGTLTFLRPDGSEVTTIAIEIAETRSERARGLMARRGMGYDRGMLFIFASAEKQTFTMENTPMPLDIIFVGPDSQVVNIADSTSPLASLYSSTAPAQFVVEVRAGFAERFGLTDSARIRWQRK